MARSIASHLVRCPSDERAPLSIILVRMSRELPPDVLYATCSKFVHCSEILLVDWKCLAFSIRTSSSFMVSGFGIVTYEVDSCVVFGIALHLA